MSPSLKQTSAAVNSHGSPDRVGKTKHRNLETSPHQAWYGVRAWHRYKCEASISLPRPVKDMTPSRTFFSRSRIAEDAVLVTERGGVIAQLFPPPRNRPRRVYPLLRAYGTRCRMDGTFSACQSMIVYLPEGPKAVQQGLPGLTLSFVRHPGGTRQGNRPHIRIVLRGQSRTRAAGDNVMSPSIPIGWATRETVCDAEAYLDPRWSLGCQPGSGGLPRQPHCLGGCIVSGYYRVGHSVGMAPQQVDLIVGGEQAGPIDDCWDQR